MTQQSLTTRLKAVEEAFEAAEAHLDFCGYGDSYEHECAKEEKLPKKIADALSDLRELIKEAEGQNKLSPLAFSWGDEDDIQAGE